MADSAALVYAGAAAMVAAAVNALAGGGTFLTFPALTGLCGLTEKAANMTSTVGLWPGSASAVVAARGQLATIPRRTLAGMAMLSVIGGGAGAWLLLSTPERSFRMLVPWLLAFATVVFAANRPIARFAARWRERGGVAMLAGAIQLVVAVYGGYFGAGIGVLMMAGLSFTGIEDLRRINALKSFLGTLINAVATVLFLWRGVDLPVAGAMAAGAVVGGIAGMRLANRVPTGWLRAAVLTAGSVLSVVYFARAYA